jgi:hypothetical protein
MTVFEADAAELQKNLTPDESSSSELLFSLKKELEAPTRVLPRPTRNYCSSV